jgi:hypothetical protein
MLGTWTAKPYEKREVVDDEEEAVEIVSSQSPAINQSYCSNMVLSGTTTSQSVVNFNNGRPMEGSTDCRYKQQQHLMMTQLL